MVGALDLCSSVRHVFFVFQCLSLPISTQYIKINTVHNTSRGQHRLFQSHILPKNFCPARELRMHVIPHPVHANEATHTQFARGRRSNMATLNYRHIGRLLHRLHFCRSYSTHFSVSVFFNSQTSIILASSCSSFVSKAAVSSQWNSMQCKLLTKCR